MPEIQTKEDAITPSMIEAAWSEFARRMPEVEEALSQQQSEEFVCAILTAGLGQRERRP